MAAETQSLVPVEEYLSTSYSPDQEYLDGVLLERNVGEQAHARLQAVLAGYLLQHEKEWNVQVFAELRIKIRDRSYRVPDICLYSKPVPEERYPEQPPLLWIEILSQDDRILDVWAKADYLVASGVPYVWIIDPHTLVSELRTAAGILPVPDKTLRLPDSPIVVPLSEMAEK